MKMIKAKNRAPQRRVPSSYKNLSPQNVKLANIGIEEFMEIEDIETKRYLFSEIGIPSENIERVIDNDEKLGYYLVSNTLCVNQKGTFYKKSKVLQWLVYDKKTKKVKISALNTYVFNKLIEENFEHIKLVRRFITKPTATFCKKIIEGKVNTIRDIIKYYCSYTIKKRALDQEVVYKYIIQGKGWYLQYLEDPQNLEDLSQLKDIPMQYIGTRGKSFKVEDIPNLKQEYNEWQNTESKRYAEFIRRRDDKHGNSSIKIPDSPGAMCSM